MSSPPSILSYSPFAFLTPIHLVEPESHIDSEYSRAGMADPKIVVTTSRDPSSKLLQFSKVSATRSVCMISKSCSTDLFKEMRLVFPNSHRINRGNYVIKELAEACRANDVTDLIILHEHRGTPGQLSLHHSITKTLLKISSLHSCRCYDCLPFPTWSHSLLHPQQCLITTRHCFIRRIHRLRTIPPSHIRELQQQTGLPYERYTSLSVPSTKGGRKTSDDICK